MQREATPASAERSPEDRRREPTDPNRTGNARGNQSSRDPARDTPARERPDGGNARPVSRADDSDKWGDLPVHVRDVFRAQGGGDMPAQYRDWIDAYYRRLAKQRGS